MTWQPTASIDALQARARLNRAIRQFFAVRDVLEVETPLLCQSTATDPHLQSFAVQAGQNTLYLQTSPEFPMKRLLAAGSGPIYQLCKAFRFEETSRLHNPEFTLLEWYRPGWMLEQLVDEVEALVLDAAAAFNVPMQPFPRFTHAAVFRQVLGLDSHCCSHADLLAAAQRHVDGDFAGLDRNGLLDLLMSHVVEPALPETGAFVVDFPASQAALAKTVRRPDGSLVAQRAELYIAGMEIANGYQELVNPAEQRDRFKADLAYRAQHGLPLLPLPAFLLGALEKGLPESAGVALGVDRLLMVLSSAKDIADVVGFPLQRA
ncbi:MAG: EF-P lysine aminoacylase EpmA [Pseudomonadota bacterium]